jgi:cell wall-associated NlpC family hydrolase
LDNYVGIPFVDGGRTLGGCDCWGLICLIYHDLLKIELPEFPISAENTEAVQEAMEGDIRAGRWIAVDQPEFGDVLAMALSPRAPRAINHVGMLIGKNSFIHAISKQRSAICSLDNQYWKKRIRGIFKWQA